MCLLSNVTTNFINYYINEEGHNYDYIYNNNNNNEEHNNP